MHRSILPTGGRDAGMQLRRPLIRRLPAARLVAPLLLALAADAVALAGASGEAPLDENGVAAAAGRTRACPLCAGSPELRSLTTAAALARAEALAALNRESIARLDARWRAGEFGPPGRRESRRRVQQLARARLRNWYAFYLPLAEANEVRRLGPETVTVLSARYVESGVFPAPRLRELRVGRGRVCARYDLGGALERGVTLLGGRRVNYRVAEISVGGETRRMLSIEWCSSGLGGVEVLLGEHYGFRLERERHADAAGPYELLLARDVQGSLVRRAGVHRPAAFAFWVTSAPAASAAGAAAPRVGSVLWLPGLRLRLPILPDIHLDDLRRLALPLPFLRVGDLRRGSLPEWLPLDGAGDLEDWSGLGDVPGNVRVLFPDR